MKFIIGNWKMNITSEEIYKFYNLKNRDGSYNIGFAVPSVYFQHAYPMSKDMRLVGLQNISEYENGAYTGEISAKMASDVGAHFCLVGHSERRKLFGETDEIVAKKIKLLQDANTMPLLCIGETWEAHEKNRTKSALTAQIEGALKYINVDRPIMFAYEPVWAIGTGKIPSLEEIEKTIKFIRSKIKTYGLNFDIIILYGGSVDATNSKQIVSLKCVDGLLIGGASQKFEKFQAIVDTFNK